MQIVIDINDNEYIGIKKYPNNITSYPVTIHLYDAVRTGTPLPKHGRLGDLDALAHKMCKANIDDLDSEEVAGLMLWFCDKAPTIIEADMAESEVKHEKEI